VLTFLALPLLQLRRFLSLSGRRVSRCVFLPRIGQASDPVVIEDPVNVISNVGRSSFHFLQVQKLLEAAHGRLAAQTAASEPWAELPTTGYSDDADPEPSEADSGSDRGAGGAGGASGSGRPGGDGGGGRTSLITGTPVIYAAGGGGGGGISPALQGGSGGSNGIGGRGGNVNDGGGTGFGGAGQTSGSGSGGAGNRAYTTAAGSTGVVIIRYPIAIA